MIKIAYSLCIIFVITVIPGTFQDLSQCTMYHLYSELGCVANYGANETCPISYDCSSTLGNADDKNCYYRGKSYSPGAYLPQNSTLNPCSINCVCSVHEKPSFSCAVVDCVLDMVAPSDDCIRTQKLDQCCSDDEVCGKDAINELSTCVVDGNTYRKGQTFYPGNTCKVCMCDETWTGDVTSSSCKDINCGVEIHNQEALAQHCAPVFTSKGGCCPIYFECPTATTKVVAKNDTISSESGCSFGDRTLRRGDEAAVTQSCTRCSCEMPPLLTCILDTDCNTR